MAPDPIEVHLHDRMVGQAWITTGRSSTSTVFLYEPDYLAQAHATQIDPALRMFTGNQAVAGLPGAFRDASPDRWGRNLITKRHRATGDARALTEIDFLLGVSDSTRQGALRFKRAGDGPFLDDATDVPKLIALPELLHAADRVSLDSDDLTAVKQLLAAGSGSLGGARPKASVVDDNGRLALAKFPKPGDDWDVMAWEATALDLAEAAGCDVPTRRLVDIDGRHLLLLDRFDRAADRRIPYISAMTLLEATDGEAMDYIDIAEALIDESAQPKLDLTELFRRAVLNVAMHNTDDHLRNHGLLHRGAGGWQLAPVFDINPNPDLNEHRVTGIAGASSPDHEAAGLRALADVCRLDEPARRSVLDDVRVACAAWDAVALRNGIGRAERARFADTFGTGLDAVADAASAAP